MLLHSLPLNTNLKAKAWTLRDVVAGEDIDLAKDTKDKTFVFLFICNHCPYVLEEIETIVQISKALQKESINIYAIMPNNYHYYTTDGPDYMKSFAEKYQFSFPYLLDEDQSVAKDCGAVCTPDIFGFNHKGVLQYRGSIHGLQEAMFLIKQSDQGPQKQMPSKGCSIKWR